MDQREKKNSTYYRHRYNVILVRTVLDFDMIRISEARKDKFLWRDGMHRKIQEKCSIACVKKMNKKLSDQKDSINREVRYGMCQSVNFLIREIKTLAR